MIKISNSQKIKIINKAIIGCVKKGILLAKKGSKFKLI